MNLQVGLPHLLLWIAIVGLLAAGYFFRRWRRRHPTVAQRPILDPLLSIGISLFVLWNVMRTLRKFVGIFLQRTPSGFDLEEFEAASRRIAGVVAVGHTHSWSIDGDSHVLTTHLTMSSGSHRGEVVAAKMALRKLLDGKAFEHLT